MSQFGFGHGLQIHTRGLQRSTSEARSPTFYKSFMGDNKQFYCMPMVKSTPVSPGLLQRLNIFALLYLLPTLEMHTKRTGHRYLKMCSP